MASLTGAGLLIDRFPDIISRIEQDLRSDVDPRIYTRDDEVLGQYNNIITGRFTEIQELVEAVYNSSILSKAEDKALDDLAALRDVTRIQESASSTTRQQFIAPNGSVVLAGTILENSVTGDRFTNPSQININTASCSQSTFEVAQAVNSETYTIQVNTSLYTIISDEDTTATEILTALFDQIVADSNRTWTPTLDGDLLTIASNDPTIPISIVSTSFLAPIEVIVEGFFQATRTGDIAVPINTVTNIVTGSSAIGVTSTTNITSYNPGRARESDEELRLRIGTTSGSECTGTVPSIIDSLLRLVEGISSINIVENVEEIVDEEGRPPHSYETIIVGGQQQDVVDELYRSKPVGIRQTGNTMGSTLDSNGNAREIFFTRPTVVNLAVEITYTLHNEQAFPAGGETVIAETAVTYVNRSEVDQDVIPKRIGASIYNTLDMGIDDITVRVQRLAAQGDTPIPGNWQLDKLDISSSEFANVASEDLTVIRG